MKLTQVTYTARKGMPSYSHEEIVAVAMIADVADQTAQLHQLRNLVNSVLHGTPVADITKTVVENTTQVSSEKVTDPAKNEAKEKAPAKEKPAAETATKTEEKAASKVEKYDRTIKDHTSTFAGFLTKTYGDAWKTKEGLKAFSEGLNGLDFRDDKGVLVPSFVAKIDSFFGTGESVL